MPAQVIDLTNLSPSNGFVIQGGATLDWAGYGVSNTGDVNGDGIDDLVIGVLYASQAYVIYGRAGATRTRIDLGALSQSDGYIVEGDGIFDQAGFSVSGAGDVNGDGLNDVIVGAYRASSGGFQAGNAYVIYGTSGTSRTQLDLTNLAQTDGFTIQGDTDYGYAGRSVANAGDVNGDGIDDLIVGAFGTYGGGERAGNAYVIYGKAGTMRTLIDLSNLSTNDGFVIQGAAAYDLAGFSVSGAGDVNGDGIDDLIVGAYGNDNGGRYAGIAYVIFGESGTARTLVDLASLVARDGFSIRGGQDDRVGRSVSNAGDINGDGIDDIVLGVYAAEIGGATYVIYGRSSATRTSIDLPSLSATDGFVIFTDGSDRAGFSVSGAGDINGDGIDDLIVGAPFNDNGGSNAGLAYVIFGRVGATRSAIDLNTLAFGEGFIIQGDTADDRAGLSVSAAGDVNNDGIDDLIVGAPFGSDGGFRAGEAYIIYGDRNFGAINGTASGETLTGTAGADRLNGFAGNDVLDGGAGADTLAGGADSDIYVVDSAGDVVSEAANEGNDRVETDLASYTLPDNVEDLEYTGAGTFTGNGNGLGNIIVGGGLGDAINGNDGDDTLGGEAGNDTLNGGNGSDRLIGGTGADTMNGEAGNDRLIVDNAGDVANGGDGIDTVDFSIGGLTYTIAGDVEIVRNVSSGDLTVTLNGLHNSFAGSLIGADTVFGGDGQDTLYGRGGNDQLNGEAGNDYLFGGEGADTLAGGDGVDLLNGGTENDNLAGGAGNDEIYGEAGDDVLFGSSGADLLHGGAGADLFYFAALTDSGTTRATSDFIRDFNQAQGDRIDLSAIDAMAGGTDEAFSFIGTAAFTGVAGQLRAELIAGETVVSGDINGDGVADFMIRIDGGFTLTAADFVL